MPCLLCASGNQAEFGAEILIHFPGLRNLDQQPVWVFPKLLICLDCGSSRFITPEGALALLSKRTATGEAAISDRVAFQRKTA
jgi:hypothetical protein